MTRQASRPRGGVISYMPSRVPEIASSVLTAALFASGFALTVTQTLI